MADKIAPVRLGCRVCFEDRWQGHVSSLEVDENWDVLNIGLTSGFLFASSSVRLPFSVVESWSDDAVHISATSFQAFGRSIPPLATPARPLSSDTPLSQPGARFAGLIVRETGRRAVEVLVSRGVAGLFRAPVKEVSFSGKTLTIALQQAQLVAYHPDSEVAEHIHRLVAEDPAIPTDDKRMIHVDVMDGVVTISGNVRVNTTQEYLAVLAARAPGVVDVRDELKVDFEIEAAVGQALSAAGLQREAQVYARSNLGEVALDGQAPSVRAAEDIVRAVVRVPGVRNVVSRIRVKSATPTAAR